MTETYLVALPPGFGKTRLVWQKIIPPKSRWKSRLAHTCIIVPNRRAKMPWLRELALYALHRRPEYVADNMDEELIRKKTSANRLRKCFRSYKINNLHIITFAELKRMSSRIFSKCTYLVFDEWHRLPNWFVNKCTASAEKGQRLYPNPRSIFLVSATPVNPVLEEDNDSSLESSAITEPYNDKNVATRERAAVGKCLNVTGGLMGQLLADDGKPYLDIMKSIGINVFHSSSRQRPWRHPKPCASVSDELIGEEEQTTIQRFLGSDSTRFADEYVWAAGLIATKWNAAKRTYQLSRKRGRSFGYEYCKTYLPRTRSHDAIKWLAETHPRVQRLWSLLEKQGVVARRSENGSWGLTMKKKVLIFCIHRGVASGLVRALKYLLPGNAESIVDISHQKKPDRTIVDFNNKDKIPFILVATDAFSESIDLHYACGFMVHYELPWSPLRLYQRIGRLTRRIGSDFNVVTSAHIIIPGSVEEERINRLIRRTEFLSRHKLLPGSGAEYLRNGRVAFNPAKCQRFTHGLLGGGDSLHLKDWLKRES